jgi:hypothetical protein
MTTLRLAVLLLLALPFARVATSCSCAPPIPGQENLKTKADLEASDIVFRGELIAHSGSVAIFRVNEQWKGNPGKEVKLEWRRGDRGDCNGFWPDDLKVGNELVVFARRGHDGVYRTSICLPTMLASSAQGLLRELGPGNTKH